MEFVDCMLVCRRRLNLPKSFHVIMISVILYHNPRYEDHQYFERIGLTKITCFPITIKVKFVWRHYQLKSNSISDQVNEWVCVLLKNQPFELVTHFSVLSSLNASWSELWFSELKKTLLSRLDSHCIVQNTNFYADFIRYDRCVGMAALQ